MRMPIETIQATGLSIYVVIVNGDTEGADNGKVWNTTLNAGAGGWQTYVSGNWAQYAIPLTEYAGSGYYRGTYPSGIGAVVTSEVVYINGAPALGDVPQGIGQSQGTNIMSVDGDADVAASLQRSLSTMVRGAVIAGTLTNKSFPTDVVNANDNAFVGRSLLFATGTLAGQGSRIVSYESSTGIITVSGPFTGAPAADDVFVIS